MKTYHIITYGCQMNEHDSENIAGLLEAMGYEHCDDPYKADITVINTCSVRDNADKRFFGTLGQFKKVKRTDLLSCCAYAAACLSSREWSKRSTGGSPGWT